MSLFCGPLPPWLQYYPDKLDMFDGMDNIINQANTIRYFLMHAIGGVCESPSWLCCWWRAKRRGEGPQHAPTLT